MLAQLSSRSFRNLEETQWQPGGGCHLVLGPNGAGKTSLLEAVYVLSTTRSFRTAQILDCRQHGEAEFHLQAEVETDQRTQLSVGLNGSGRYRSVNDSATSLVEHLRVLPVVAWTAAESSLLIGPPAGRRRFLDQGIVGAHPGALEVLARYRRALGQKKELLFRGGPGLSSWNGVMAQEASQLMVLRRDYVRQIGEALDQIVSLLGIDLPPIQLTYRPSIEGKYEDPTEVFDALDAIRDQERIESRSLLGPHRDELEIRWGEHLIKRVGSAGERKILGLVISAARGRVLTSEGRSPTYLLDDVDSELDGRRLGAIWEVFSDAKQLLVSSNREALWSIAPEAWRWHLETGHLKSE